MATSLWQQMKRLPELTLPQTDATLEVSLLIPARNSSHSLEATVREAHRFFQARFPGSFEIILIPNPEPASPEDRSLHVAQRQAERFAEVLVHPHGEPVGKGAGLREGLRHARGKWILFTDADLPYDLTFFDQAIAKLRAGYDLVTGNRRLPHSHFHVPVSLLPLAYGRHRLGLGFNQVVRLLLPIHTTDTQAGIKAMSRRLAFESFARLRCPGFFFDLEIFLTAQGRGYRQIDLPVTLHLNTEKSTVRILRESVLAGLWLTRITLRHKRGAYGRPPARTRGILRAYPKTSWLTRLFLTARWYLTPYSVIAGHLPREGEILDLGCGHGLLAQVMARDFPERKVLGIDHDPERIALATQASREATNLRFASGNVTDLPSRDYAGITLIDVMHYFDPESQERILRKAHQALRTGGTLLVREVDPRGGLISRWNRLYERLATGSGFTRAEKKGLHFRSRDEWEELLREIGFEVRSERCSSPIFSDILFVAERPGPEPTFPPTL